MIDGEVETQPEDLNSHGHGAGKWQNRKLDLIWSWLLEEEASSPTHLSILGKLSELVEVQGHYLLCLGNVCCSNKTLTFFTFRHLALNL